MHKHTAVRIKGSRWEAVARRPGGSQPVDGAHAGPNPGRGGYGWTDLAGEDDMLLDLAVRHFAELDLSTAEAHEFAAALLHVTATGETTCIYPASSTRHAYEISRRVAAIEIRFGTSRICLPRYAALQLADCLERRQAGGVPENMAA